MNETAEIGIFGGTGIYDSGLLKESKEIEIDTPYGKPSDSITIGEFNLSLIHISEPTRPERIGDMG